MRREAPPPSSGIYRPRNPRASPLYRCVRQHAEELEGADLIKRPVESQVLERFLACDDLHKGFARIYCDQCGHDYLLAYSCKTRYFCPSCHQKRMLAYGEWLEDNLLAPVPHRQYVFTLPKLVRPLFRYRRRYLGDLCRLVAGLLKAGYTAMDPRPILDTSGLANTIEFLILRSSCGIAVSLRPVPDRASQSFRRVNPTLLSAVAFSIARIHSMTGAPSESRVYSATSNARFRCPAWFWLANRVDWLLSSTEQIGEWLYCQ